MDVKAMTKEFDFTSMGSIYEKKQVLIRKNELVEQRLAEVEMKGQSHAKMLNQLQLKHYEDTKQQMVLHQKKEEVTATVEELKHVE